MRVSEAMSQAIEDFLEKVPELDAHESARDNPHEVTKEQVGLGNVTNEAQATKAEFTAHENANDNPHSVTKEQVGLGNLVNEEQATKTEFTAHTAGTSGRHTAEDIDYSESHTVKQKIDEIIIEGGGGTMYHNELLNRESANAHPISAITGLSGRLEEVIVFEGETEGAETVRLTTDYTGDFIDSNGLTMPEGMAVNVEIAGCSVSYEYDEQEGKYKIKSIAGTCFFRTEGAVARVNSVVMNSFDTVTVYNMNTSQGAIPSELAIAKDGPKKIKFNATGVADQTLRWRVEVRLKNIINLNG